MTLKRFVEDGGQWFSTVTCLLECKMMMMMMMVYCNSHFNLRNSYLDFCLGYLLV
jgi:hypothetical protein